MNRIVQSILVGILCLAFCKNACAAGTVGTANEQPANESSGASSSGPYIPPPMATDAGIENARARESMRYQPDIETSERIFYEPLLPALKKHFEGRQVDTFLELGPYRLISVPRALNGTYSQYIGLDINRDAVTVMQEELDREHLTKARAIYGDAYNLALPDSSVDVVFASRLTPLGSIHATRQSLERVYREIERVLKPGGEFILFPQPRNEIAQFDPSAEIFDEFERVQIHEPKVKEELYMLFFHKRAKKQPLVH